MGNSRPEVTQPLLEWLTPHKSDFNEHGYFVDIIRMRVPGGWLVTKLFMFYTTNRTLHVTQSTTYVPDPDGTWNPRNDASPQEI